MQVDEVRPLGTRYRPRQPGDNAGDEYGRASQALVTPLPCQRSLPISTTLVMNRNWGDGTRGETAAPHGFDGASVRHRPRNG